MSTNNTNNIEDIEFKPDTLKDYTDNLSTFLDSNENEISEQIVIFVRKWIDIQDEKKALAKKESDLKAHYTKCGVPVSRVTAVIDKMKRRITQKPNEKQEEEEIYNLFLEQDLAKDIKDVFK